MIWQNPWAWAGLVAVGLPVLIHLLGRGHARVRKFPTLRFVAPSRLLPTRRTRVHDWLLLAVRVGIITAAVAALAQPLLLTKGPTRAAGNFISRVIIVDTSASMRRTASGIGQALDVARREAQRVVRESQSKAIVIETAAPAHVLAGAVAWLDRQPGRHEIVVVSDFQIGALDRDDLSAVPPGVGVRLRRIRLNVPPGALEVSSRQGDLETVARVGARAERTDVEWPSAVPVTPALEDNPLLFAGTAERGRADAAQRAARTVAVRLPLDSTRPIAIVFPGYEQRADVLRGASLPHAPWMTSVVERLAADSMLLAAAATAMPATGVDAQGLIVARSASGKAIIVATQAQIQGRDRLVLFALTDAGSLASAALIAAGTRALSLAPAVTELEPAVVSDSVLTSWIRYPAANARARTSSGESDGRWFWILALLLIGLETVLRRTLPAARSTPRVYDQAA